jgi:hypothetical protein
MRHSHRKKGAQRPVPCGARNLTVAIISLRGGATDHARCAAALGRARRSWAAWLRRPCANCPVEQHIRQQCVPISADRPADSRRARRTTTGSARRPPSRCSHPRRRLGGLRIRKVGGSGRTPTRPFLRLAYCLRTNQRTLTGLIFSALFNGVVLAVRIFGMAVDSTVQQSSALVKGEIVVVVISLVGITIEIGRRSYARHTIPFP